MLISGIFKSILVSPKDIIWGVMDMSSRSEIHAIEGFGEFSDNEFQKLLMRNEAE